MDLIQLSYHIELFTLQVVCGITSIPFIEVILRKEVLKGFIIPKFNIFNWICYLLEYLLHILEIMILMEGNDLLYCKGFLPSLQRPSLMWFYKL